MCSAHGYKSHQVLGNREFHGNQDPSDPPCRVSIESAIKHRSWLNSFVPRSSQGTASALCRSVAAPVALDVVESSAAMSWNLRFTWLGNKQYKYKQICCTNMLEILFWMVLACVRIGAHYMYHHLNTYNTHTYIYVYMYIYIYVCDYVCV